MAPAIRLNINAVVIIIPNEIAANFNGDQNVHMENLGVMFFFIFLPLFLSILS